MKKLVIALLFLVLLPLTVQAKQKIAVFPFGTNYRDDVGAVKMAEDHCVDFLVKQNRFDVIERAQLGRLLSEQALQAGAMIDQDTAVSVGKLAGIKYAVLGEITQVSYSIVHGTDLNGKPMDQVKAVLEISLRIVDVETGQIIFSQTFKRPNGDIFSSIIVVKQTPIELFTGWVTDIYKDDVSKKMNQMFPLSGEIATVEDGGKSVILDIGGQDGVKKDMKFKVIQVTQKTIASANKTVNIVKTVGRVQVKEVQDETCTADVKEGGSDMKEGMKIVSDDK